MLRKGLRQKNENTARAGSGWIPRDGAGVLASRCKRVMNGGWKVPMLYLAAFVFIGWMIYAGLRGAGFIDIVKNVVASMTLEPIAVVPAIASFAVMRWSSIASALFWVYLPVILLLPENYTWGLPPLSFHQYAIVPIGIVLCWRAMSGRWNGSPLDVAVFAFIGWMIVADFHSAGFVDIVKRIVTPLTLAVFPYMAGKLLIEQAGLRVAFARRFAFLLFVDVLLSVYEFHMGVNPFRLVLGRFFSSPSPWFTQIRYGLGRTAGPFGHAILMGTAVAIAILFHRYLMHFGLWEGRFRWLPGLPLNKPWIMLLSLIAGSIMTLSRGPWLAVAAGAMFASVGTSRDRGRALKRTVVVLVLCGTLVYSVGKTYVSDSAPSHAGQEERASAQYRAQLFDEYREIALQRTLWGWGSLYWPRVAGMASVDNWYLLVTLMYGVTGLVLFATMLATAFLLLIRNGLAATDLDGEHRALFFTLSGIIVAIAVAIATVFLGSQLYPLLFLLLGWSDACLRNRTQRGSTPAPERAPQFAFRSVLA
jgi:hypothetical protein